MLLFSRVFMSILRERTVDVLLQVSKKSRNSQTYKIVLKN